MTKETRCSMGACSQKLSKHNDYSLDGDGFRLVQNEIHRHELTFN